MPTDQSQYDEWLEQTRRAVVAGIIEHALTSSPVTLPVIARALTGALTSAGLAHVPDQVQAEREDRIGATGMWWLRELAGSINLDDIADAGQWVRANTGDGPAVAVTLLTKAVWENDQDTQIRVLTDAGETRRRYLPLMGVAALVATAGNGMPDWLYATTGHAPPPVQLPGGFRAGTDPSPT